MKITGIDHVGVAVKSIRERRRFYEKELGLRVGQEIEFASGGIKLADVDFPGTKIELLEPASEESTIAKFLAQRGEGIHHLCLLVEDIEAALAELGGQGLRLIDRTPRLNPHGDKIAFIHPESTGGVLLELKDKKKGKNRASFKNSVGVLMTKGRLTRVLLEERKRRPR